MSKPYYILVVRNDGLEKPRNDADWLVMFGDYDRETVEFELQDYRDHGARKCDLKIVKLPDATQYKINNVVEALNGRNPDIGFIGNV